MDEVIVVNENDEVLGTMTKKEAHRDGTLHRIAVVYVENDKGQFLVQVRKDGHLDHSAAGHVDPGESYEEAAKRELAEELGIKNIPLKKIGHGQTRNEKYPNSVSSHIFDIFVCKAKPESLQEEEVTSVYWATPADVLADMQLHPSDKYCGGFRVSLPIFADYLRS